MKFFQIELTNEMIEMIKRCFQLTNDHQVRSLLQHHCDALLAEVVRRKQLDETEQMIMKVLKISRNGKFLNCCLSEPFLLYDNIFWYGVNL